MKHTAMLIEDDADTQAIVRHFLTSAGFEFNCARTGAAGLQMLDATPADVLILDLTLPDMDGTDICRRVRRDHSIPILMLTARHTQSDKLLGFDLGADDYIGKPFDPQELVARVRAVLRRTKPDLLDSKPPGGTLKIGDVTVDVSRHLVRAGDEEINLTPTEFRLLVLLIKDPGRLVSREEAMVAVYGNTHDRDLRTVDSHISHLRRKLDAKTADGPHIENIYGLGYRVSS